MKHIRFELNITLQCNLSCNNCNRLCNVFPYREEHMTPSQIDKWVCEVEHKRKEFFVSKIKVLGGEPLLNPFFVDIYNILLNATEKGLIGLIYIDTNKTIERPYGLKDSKNIFWIGTKQSNKIHIPSLWMPQDLSLNTFLDCRIYKRCGMSLDKYGYLPCSPAIMINRIFNLNLYKKTIVNDVWGLHKLCRYCFKSASQNEQKKYAKPLNLITNLEKKPTRSWEIALKKFDYDKFYRLNNEY